jgi:hypothetical protein
MFVFWFDAFALRVGKAEHDLAKELHELFIMSICLLYLSIIFGVNSFSCFFILSLLRVIWIIFCFIFTEFAPYEYDFLIICILYGLKFAHTILIKYFFIHDLINNEL